MRFFLYLVLSFISARAANPIIPNRGINDPHIRIHDGKAYLFASHDRSINNPTFVMDDWRVYSSPDLVNWKLESVVTPEMTYIGKSFLGCWATDAAFRNGKCFFYFSEKNQRTGVMVADSPAGPWLDPLKRPLLDSDLTPTDEYDVCIFQDENKTPYIIFGVWDYYIARLNDDMISLAEAPRKLVVHPKFGPYGEGKLDDKPDLHKANGHYYLSWGCFYAMADEIYGPYVYQGAVMDAATSFAPGYAAPTWPKGPLQGRHGNFFSWHNQSYFTYCDISQTGNRYFRDSFISYVHYKDNGEMAFVRVDGVGVGQYGSDHGPIEAEDYFKAEGMRKRQISGGGFAVTPGAQGGSLTFPNIRGLATCNRITLNFTSGAGSGLPVEVRESTPAGRLLATIVLRDASVNSKLQSLTQLFTAAPSSETLCFVFPKNTSQMIEFDSFTVEK